MTFWPVVRKEGREEVGRDFRLYHMRLPRRRHTLDSLRHSQHGRGGQVMKRQPMTPSRNNKYNYQLFPKNPTDRFSLSSETSTLNANSQHVFIL